MWEKTLSFVRNQIKEHTYLGKEGKFVTTPEFPEFVWKEIIINAATHRDYSIKGTDIQVKMFDDRIVVESPGNLPGRSDTQRTDSKKSIPLQALPAFHGRPVWSAAYGWLLVNAADKLMSFPDGQTATIPF